MPRIVVLMATLCALTGIAHADSTAADTAERDAEALAAAGDFVGAAAKYREAYAADPRVKLMCNVGIAYHKAKDLPRSQLWLSHCLKRGTALDAQFVAAVRGVLATVEGALKTGDFTPVDIVVDPEATSVTIAAFGSEASVIGPHLVWLPYGTHELTFKAEGYVDQTISLTVNNHDTVPTSVKLEKKPDPKPIVIKPKIEHRTHSLLPAIGTSAITLGAIIFTIVAYDKAHSRSDIAAFATSDAVYATDETYIDRWNRNMVIGSAVTFVGALASGFLWYRALTTDTKVEVTPTPSGAAVTFRTSF